MVNQTKFKDYKEVCLLGSKVKELIYSLCTAHTLFVQQFGNAFTVASLYSPTFSPHDDLKQHSFFSVKSSFGVTIIPGLFTTVLSTDIYYSTVS